MKKAIIIVPICALAIGVTLFIIFKRSNYNKRLTKALQTKDFKKFDEIINEKFIKHCFDEFTINYMKLNKAFATANNNEILSILNTFENMKLNEMKKVYIYNNAFMYFVVKKDKTNAKKYLAKFEQLEDKTLFERGQIYYDVQLEKSDKYLDQLLKEYEEAKSKEEKLSAALLISTIYKNKNDNVNFKKFQEIIEKENK